MAVEMIRALGGGVSYMMVNEAGASVYSAASWRRRSSRSMT
mgnify:CR=1 FL=1